MRTLCLVMSGIFVISGATLSSDSMAAQELPIQGSFEQQTLDRAIVNPWLKTVGDLDGDGRTDIVVGGAKGGGLVAYLNRFPKWDQEAIDLNRRFSTDGEVADLDGDGRKDLVVLTLGPDTVTWYRHTESGWTPQLITHQTWHDLEVADFDGDGLLDIVGRNQREWPAKDDAGDLLHFLWPKRQGTNVVWEASSLGCPAGEGLLSVDLDGDEDQDVIINGTWYENVGKRRWTARTFARPQDWSHPNTFIAGADLNHDGRLDLVLTPSELKGGHSRITWFEAPADPRQDGWQSHVIVPDVETVCHFVGAADFDGDGRVDVAYAQMPQGADPDLVRVLFNRGTREASGWIDDWQPLTISEDGSHSMRILDADKDGRPDLVGANWSAEGRDEEVKLWLNRLQENPTQPPTHAWQRWESALISSHTYANPYAEVTLGVTFTGPGQRVIRTYGFWDGGATFRLRCAFPAPGTWEWRTECSDSANGGLHGQRGSVNVLPYNGNNPLYGHGFLKVSENRRYLTLGDGTPFLWIGDSAWAVPMRATDGEWEQYLTDRVSKHFSVLQVAPAPQWAGATDRQGQEPFIDNSSGQWNPVYWQSFERKIQRANESGLVVLLVGLMEPVSRYPESREACLFARNVVSRLFGNFVIFSPSFDSEVMPLANLVGRAVRDATTSHLVTQHPGTPWNQPTPTFSDKYYDESYLDFVGVQTGHNGGHLDWCAHHAIEWNLYLHRHEPHKPVINLEAMYDARGTNGWRAADARSLGWRTWLSGAAGYTYGAGDLPPKVPQGSGAIWKWVTDPEKYDYWKKALQWESAFQMQYLHDFLGAIDWWRLEPAHDLIRNQPDDVTVRAVLARSAPGDLAVAYLPTDDAIVIDLSSFPGPLRARWYDPVHGGYAPIAGRIESHEKNCHFTPPKGEDWVLLLQQHE